MPDGTACVLGRCAGHQFDPEERGQRGKEAAFARPCPCRQNREADWVAESFQDAQQDVYVSPIGNGLGPFQLTSAYKKAAKKLAQQRVALAGARLANMINTELK